MRIVIDMQGAQTASRFRGIGRYTMAIAQAIARNRGTHEVILVLNGLFDQSIEPLRRAFTDLLPAQNILVWQAPGPVNVSDPANLWREEVAEQLREAFLASLQPDVVYLSSLFEGFVDDAITSVHRFDSQALVCTTVYDFIPLLNPEQYLAPNPIYARYYEKKISEMKKADLFLAISQSSRREAIEYLGIKPESVVSIAAACDESFASISVEETTRQALLGKWGITRPFILYTGGADHRKNLSRLIQSFTALPHEIRTTHQLVFAGKLSSVEIAHLENTAATHGLPLADLRLTGFVTDDELVAAYNLCRLFIFPSWHEGFGLPPLEAMSCGAAVITSNTSSLPEVMGMEAALFDPFSVEAITAKMQQALTDEVFRGQLVANGRRQARKFSWDASARIAIKTFERSHRQRQETALAMRPWREVGTAHYTRLLQALTSMLLAHRVSDDGNLSILASCMAHNEEIAQSLSRSGLLPTTLLWRIEGPFDSSYSLALVNREFARGLEKIGHQVALHSSEGPGDFQANGQFLLANPDLAVMHQRVAGMPSSKADIVSRFMYPPRVEDMDSRFNALHCYGWEESQFPAPWVDAFNLHLQGITVMSSHVAKLLIDSGVHVPIAVTGLGVDHWERIAPDADFRLQAKSFRFLHVSSCFPRKGVKAMLRAYAQAFRAHDDVTLIIKTFENPHNEIHQWLKEVQEGDANFPDVQILEADYSDSQLKALYQQCHTLVAPSKAEGFGLPLAEAMLEGMAVITTGWSGQIDFCTSDTAWLVDYAFVRAQSHFQLADSVWAEPDTHHLARTLREVHDAPESQRRQRAQAGRNLLLSHFTWAQVAERSVQAIRSWAVQGARVPPRIGWITSWNTRCGIASYSEHLLREMSPDIQILASHANPLTRDDDDRVIRCWQQGDIDTLGELSLAVETAGVDTLVVQFNYGFFDLPKLASFLDAQVSAGRTVVVEMHSTTDPAQVSYKKLADLVPALARCSRVLAHSLADMNRLKNQGLVDNVSLFPHGILDYQTQAPPIRPDGQFVVASYGYFLPHKGLLELIDAVLLLRAQGVSILLKMVNSEYPAPQSADVIEQAKTKISAAQAQDTIELITEYLDDDESLRLLSAANLIVFPYQETGESASGAVRYGLASGRPVVVTPLSIFDDVREAVYELPGTAPEHIAQGIRALIKRIEHTQSEMSEKSKAVAQWCFEHRHSSLAKRMTNMLTALHGQYRVCG